MKMVEKTTLSERINHLVLALSFFVLVLTGFGFAFNSLNWITRIFGGGAAAATIHEWGGVVFLLSLVITVGSYFNESISFGEEDRAWIRLRGGYLDRHVELPPQGRLNFGQKMFYLFGVLASGLVVSASGFMIWGHSGVLLGHILHNLAFFVMVSFIPVHLYLATAANPGTFRVMTRGTVPLAWARKHHAKWVKDMKLE